MEEIIGGATGRRPVPSHAFCPLLEMSPDADDLELMPRVVRDKLNLVGIKVHLKDWQRFTLAERRQLVDQPCHSEGEIEVYRAVVERLVRKYTGRAPERSGGSGER